MFGEEFIVSVPPDAGDVRFNDLEVGPERRLREGLEKAASSLSQLYAQMDPRKVAATQMVGYGPLSADCGWTFRWQCWSLSVSVARSDCGNFLWLHSHSGRHHQPAHIRKCEQGLGRHLKMQRQRSVEPLSSLFSLALR